MNSSLAHGLACSWTEQRQPWTWSQRKSHRAPEAEAPAPPARLAEDRERGFANIGRRQLGQRVELGHTEGWSASKRINAPQNPVAAPARAASFAKQACRTDPARRMARPRIPWWELPSVLPPAGRDHSQ